MTDQIIAKGYKQTEVGVIPDDWEIVFLSEFTTIKRGKFTPRPRNDPKYYGGKIPFVQTTNVVNSKGVISEYTQTLNNEGLGVSRLFPKGTILMTIAANIGYTGIIQKDMACPDSLVGIGCKDNLSNEFLNFYFMMIQHKIEHLAEEAAQKNINLSVINRLKIPLPPKPEQQKIADILTTWDEAIEKQTALIQQKQQLKKGLMQQLLTGKTRFSEFSDDWQIEKLSEISKITMGQSPSSNSYNDEQVGMPLIQGNADCKNRKTLPRRYTTKKTKECFIGDIIMTVRAPVGAISKSLDNACIGRGVCAIKSNNKNEFLYHFLVHYEQKWETYSQGSTFTAVNSSDVKNLKIPLPPKPEQQKIAQVLTLADDETTQLQNELALLKTQKKGLMQKLLTGKIRVKF